MRLALVESKRQNALRLDMPVHAGVGYHRRGTERAFRSVRVGVEFNLRCAAGGKDKGGKPATDGNMPVVWLGATLAVRNGKTLFVSVDNGGSAELSGVSPGDELIALDGLRMDLAGCEARTRRYRPGDRTDLTVFRGDELITLRMKWQEAPLDTGYLVLADDVDDDIASRRAGWLGA